MDIVERIARVLAGTRFSRNADDAGPSDVADADMVDLNWRDFQGDALAVLRTMREPDEVMVVAAGTPNAAAIWERMVRAAVDE